MFKVNSGARLSKLIQIIKRTCLDVTAVPKSNRKFAETETKSQVLTHIHPKAHCPGFVKSLQ